MEYLPGVPGGFVLTREYEKGEGIMIPMAQVYSGMVIVFTLLVIWILLQTIGFLRGLFKRGSQPMEKE